MNEFWLWFSTGRQHILDWNGYDHILYVVTLCILFSIHQWKNLLVLITAFTIGHSFTLAISSLNIFSVQQSYIEVMIPLTIIATCVVNLFSVRSKSLHQNNRDLVEGSYKLNYALALFFGLIHGMGFSYMLKSMLGKEESVIGPLLAFNLGLEFGQLIIVCCMLLLSVFLIRFTRIKKTDYIFFVSSAVFGITFLLFIQRLNDL